MHIKDVCNMWAELSLRESCLVGIVKNEIVLPIVFFIRFHSIFWMNTYWRQLQRTVMWLSHRYFLIVLVLILIFTFSLISMTIFKKFDNLTFRKKLYQLWNQHFNTHFCLFFFLLIFFHCFSLVESVQSVLLKELQQNEQNP